MMAAQRSTVAGDKCSHSKEGLHADTESGCQVQYITVQYSTLQYSTVQYSKEGLNFQKKGQNSQDIIYLYLFP